MYNNKLKFNVTDFAVTERRNKMSFHTFELKYKIRDVTRSMEIFESLSKPGGKFYKDKKEYADTWVCEKLRDNGIIIKIRNIKKNGYMHEMLYYKINPRRVMNDNDYIGLFESSEAKDMLNRIDELIESKFNMALPSVESMKLNRIDFCTNVLLNGQEEVKAYIEILKRGLTLKKYSLQKYDNPIAKRKTLSKNGLTYIGENGVNITYYNKFREMSEQNLPMRDVEQLNKILRIEIQCKNKKVKRLYKKYMIKDVNGFLYLSNKIGREIFEKYSNLFCGAGDFYRLDAVKRSIEKSSFKTNTKKLMTELAEYSAKHSSLDKAVSEMSERYGDDKTQKVLKKFDELGISPVIIPRRSVIKYAGNPLKLALKAY